MRLPVSVAVLGSLALLGCTHLATLDRAGYAVEFHGGRLNGSPVEVETVEEGGYRFQIERSVFLYEITPPFQSFQSIASISLADPTASWSLDAADLSTAFAKILAQMTKTLPNASCEPPRPDTSLDRSGIESLCKASAEGMTYSMRLRMVPARRGVLLQFASWTGEKGQAWTAAFWSSLHATGPGATVAGAAIHAAIPTDALSRQVDMLATR